MNQGQLTRQVVCEIWPAFEAHFRSDTTKASYWSDLCEFSEIIGKDILSVSKKDVEHYYEYMMKKVKDGKLQPASMKKKMMELHSFCAYLKENKEGFRVPDCFDDFFYTYLPHLEKQERYARSVSAEYVDKLLCASQNDRMVYTVLTLLYRIGLSSTEICSLKEDAPAIYDNGPYLYVEERNQALYLPDDVLKVLDRYMETRGENAFLFYNKRGKPLNTMYISRMMKKYADIAGIPSCSARDLRNTCACNLFSYHAGAEQVAAYMGVTCTHIQRYKNRVYQEEVTKAAGRLVKIKVEVPV